jgi:hypothetical protein
MIGDSVEFPRKNTAKFFHLTKSLTFAFPKKQGVIASVLVLCRKFRFNVSMKSSLSSSVGRAADL